MPLMPNYKRLPVAFARGEGALLWDEEGKEYLDAIGGIAVCALGHAHPAVVQAISEQASTLMHTSNLFEIVWQKKLGARLCELSQMENAFFCNSGAEANEAALKLARLHGRAKNYRCPEVIVMEGSFHGRTLATLSASGSRKVQAGYEPLVQGFVRVPYNDVEAVKRIAAHNNEITAVLVEPVLGEGGVVLPSQGYLHELREICDQQGWLLMLDEIQTGMGRTGKWFAHQHENILPDVMTLAKALGNGVPIGACLARGPAAQLFKPGHHGSTFGGNPFVCRVALSVIETLQREKLVERASMLGERILKQLQQQLLPHEAIREIRGKGLMIGIEFNASCVELAQRALSDGLVINVTVDNVVRLLPPLTLSDEQADEIVRKLAAVIKEYLDKR